MDDHISRQAALGYIERVLTIGTGKKKSLEYIRKYIEALPSAQPKKGKWLPDNNDYEHLYYYCSNCRRATQIPRYVGGFLYDFCPNCGADMRGNADE